LCDFPRIGSALSDELVHRRLIPVVPDAITEHGWV
jgi:hypothetical protein